MKSMKVSRVKASLLRLSALALVGREGSDAIGAKRTCRERRERVDLTKMTRRRHRCIAASYATASLDSSDESSFATVRHRTVRSKGCLSNFSVSSISFFLLVLSRVSVDFGRFCILVFRIGSSILESEAKGWS
jgi:hypothetical protein